MDVCMVCHVLALTTPYRVPVNCAKQDTRDNDKMPDDCYFPENDEKDDSDMEFDINHTLSPPMTTNHLYNSANSSGVYNEESSDEAPDDVTFETSKTSALQEIKDAFESAKLQKQRKKEKRQKKQEVFADQKLKKKQRLDELASKKLSDDILQNISSIQQINNGTETTIEPKSSISHDGHNVQREEPTKSSSKSGGKMRRRKKRNQLCKPPGELPPKETLDFIPVNSKATEFHVRVLEKTVDNVVGKTVLLKDLKNKLIFGPLKRREPVLQAMAKITKQEIAGLNKRNMRK